VFYSSVNVNVTISDHYLHYFDSETISGVGSLCFEVHVYYIVCRCNRQSSEWAKSDWSL